MKKILIYVVPLVAIIVLINFRSINWITGPDDIFYSNGNGTFTFDEYNSSGRNYELCLRNWEAFKLTNSNDTILYRITSKNIFKFWRWGNYLSDKKYRLPYKSWKEIEAIRGPVVNKTGFQAF